MSNNTVLGDFKIWVHETDPVNAELVCECVDTFQYTEDDQLAQSLMKKTNSLSNYATLAQITALYNLVNP